MSVQNKPARQLVLTKLK